MSLFTDEEKKRFEAFERENPRPEAAAGRNPLVRPITEEEKAKYANVKLRDGEIPATQAITEGKLYPKPLKITKIATAAADFYAVE